MRGSLSDNQAQLPVKKYKNIEIYPGYCGLLEQTVDYLTPGNPACLNVLTETLAVSGWVTGPAPRTVGLKKTSV